MSMIHPLQPRRTIISHAQPHAYGASTVSILGKLGYAIVPAEEFGPDTACPDLRIVDERRLGEIPDDESEVIPTLVITGQQGVTGADPRIVGAVHRPAGIHDLYRLFQQILEEVPRNTPRVPTHLLATCRKGEEEWPATVLSLSENGCLVRTVAPLPLGCYFDLSFSLPGAGRIATEAQAAYQLVPDLGLVFHRTRAASREAISRYILNALSTL